MTDSSIPLAWPRVATDMHAMVVVMLDDIAPAQPSQHDGDDNEDDRAGHDKIAGVLHGAEQRLFVRPQKLRRQPFGPAFLIITGTRDILKVPPSFLCHAGLCTNPNPCDNLTTQVQTEYNKK